MSQTADNQVIAELKAKIEDLTTKLDSKTAECEGLERQLIELYGYVNERYDRMMAVRRALGMSDLEAGDAVDREGEIARR